MASSLALSTLSLPIPWHEFALPSPLQTRSTTLIDGDVGWDWEPQIPQFEVAACEAAPGASAPGWDLDHVVLLVPDLEDAVETMARIGAAPRLRVEVKGRPTAFFRVGAVLEVIESPVRAPSLFGVALVTEEPLEVVILRWRSMGRDVTAARPAIQPGRRIFTVKGTEAGLAVMSPDRSPPA